MTGENEVGAIDGVRLLRPVRHQDDRGFVLEVFRESDLDSGFVQANHSHSRSGVLRGLHYHRRQSDAWYVVSGRAQVALVDLREPDRPVTATVELSGDDPATLLIPPGVAHGFLALTELDLLYWVSEYYDASDEFGVAWNDPSVGVPWKTSDPILSERDATAPLFDRPRTG
ncbi:MAG: dTDP-4-dehydrorhamnose 3,5-epimerase family protein [Actinomycetota bacterium]|nr:dTDP-4-dehydrorhamnose 3,5-epimerase family protein [Actinomycetota bacterium]